MPDVLVVDDDRGVRRSLIHALALEGFDVREAADGLIALDAITAHPPSAVVLDIGMPGLAGVDVVRRIRALDRALPVCLLSAREKSGDRAAGLAAGADDCLVRPFPVGELTARLRAMVRPHPAGEERTLLLGDLSIEPARRVAGRRGRDLDLTAREFDLLAVLARHCGRVLGRAELLHQVWGYTWEVDSIVVDIFVGSLRTKLEAAGEPRILESVRGNGFVLNP